MDRSTRYPAALLALILLTGTAMSCAAAVGAVGGYVIYRETLPIGTKVRLESRKLKKKGQFVILEGKAFRAADGAVVAESQGFFNVFDPGTAAIG